MTTAEGSLPKVTHASNWNILRSKSIPSGTSGSHAAAKPTQSPAIEGITPDKGELTASKQRRRQLKEFHTIDPIGMKH